MARVVLADPLLLFPVFLGADFSKTAPVFAAEPADRDVPARLPRQQGAARAESAWDRWVLRWKLCTRRVTSELASQLAAGNPHGRVKSLNAVTADMQVAAAEEVRKLESYMPWLATTGSVTPFIGLFGTVWGVMDAFSGLGTAGAASLRVVAPGIAEALITTAAGLFTAIPAVIAYNHFVHDIRELGARMDNFTMEVAALIEKQYL